MSEQRKPAVFKLTPEPAPKSATERPQAKQRAPRAVKPEQAIVIADEVDVFDESAHATDAPPPVSVAKRRFSWLGLLTGALGVLLSLAIGLWTDALIRDLFSRADWLGWLALATAALALVALLVILVREGLALAQLASVEKLRSEAETAIERNDPNLARAVVDKLSALVAHQSETAAGRRLLEQQRGEIVDGSDLLRLAETDILAPLDARAQGLILDAAKRVSLVTAVSPRALVDIAYVIFEASKLVRAIATLYGGRPGTLGFFRLARTVLGHLAVTGSIAVGDSFVQQIVGHGLAARLSAKLGEGVVNGMMTARIGLAAMEVSRPLPFTAVKQPGMSDFLSALTRFATAKTAPEK